jgi:hypothetical protein
MAGGATDTALALALANATTTTTATTTATDLATTTTTITTTAAATATATTNATATATTTTLTTATTINVEGNFWVTGKLLAAAREGGWGSRSCCLYLLIFLTADFCWLIFVFVRVPAKLSNCNSVHWSAFIIPHNFHFALCLLHCLFFLTAMTMTIQGLTSPLAPLLIPICASPERSGWVVATCFLSIFQFHSLAIFGFLFWRH